MYASYRVDAIVRAALTRGDAERSQEWYADSDTADMVGFELGGKQLTFWPTKRTDQTYTPWDYRVTCVKDGANMEVRPATRESLDQGLGSEHLNPET
jgi:hypothetical protein